MLERPILRGRVNFPVCLAPMVGLTHGALRRVVRRYQPLGAQTIWPTEMLSSWKLPHQSLGETPETLLFESEDGLVPQILGNEAEPIRKSIQALKNWGAQGIDINMGCPVKKALRHNYGVALMGDPKYAAEVVSMAKTDQDLPVSVKLRSGFQSDPNYLKEFVQGLEAAGAEWITLHPRLAGEKRRGEADWSEVGELRAHLKCAVIGNGDIQTAAEALGRLSETNCDMVMVGRALAARPWLLWQVGEELGWPPPPGRSGPAPRTPEEEGTEYGRALDLLIESFQRNPFQDRAWRQLLFYLRTTTPWLEYGNALFSIANQARNLDAAREKAREFFAQEQRMYSRTQLRT